jgi:hypothetical protein
MDADHPAGPLVRIEEAGLGPEAQVRVVVSGVSDPARLRGPWASSGAVVELVGQRLRATTTVQALARAAGRALDSAEAETLDRRLREAVAAWVGPPPLLQAATGALPTDVRPLVMGVVNVTPDSFSDGGEVYPDGHPDAAVDRAHHLVGARGGRRARGGGGGPRGRGGGRGGARRRPPRLTRARGRARARDRGRRTRRPAPRTGDGRARSDTDRRCRRSRAGRRGWESDSTCHRSYRSVYHRIAI